MLTPLRDTVVDFSYPYFIGRTGFMTKKPSHLPKVMAILWPYDNLVWICLAVTVPTFFLAYWTFSKIDKVELLDRLNSKGEFPNSNLERKSS